MGSLLRSELYGAVADVAERGDTRLVRVCLFVCCGCEREAPLPEVCVYVCCACAREGREEQRCAPACHPCWLRQSCTPSPLHIPRFYSWHEFHAHSRGAGAAAGAAGGGGGGADSGAGRGAVAAAGSTAGHSTGGGGGACVVDSSGALPPVCARTWWVRRSSSEGWSYKKGNASSYSWIAGQAAVPSRQLDCGPDGAQVGVVARV